MGYFHVKAVSRSISICGVLLCRRRKKAKAAELQQQVQEMSAKAANLQAAKATQAKLKVCSQQGTATATWFRV